jgi:hypothetical protein
MPTGMTTTAGQHVMNTALFEILFTEDVRSLGAAIARAKQQLLANGDAYFEQVSATFLLFGDPAMQLKVPMPRRPVQLKADFRNRGGVKLRWSKALDCDGLAVAGYNVYRSTGASGVFEKLNGALIRATEYIDTTAKAGRSSPAAGAASATTYYYAVTSVDTDGDESIQSAMVSPSPAAASSVGANSPGSSGGGGGCFITTAKSSRGSAGTYLVIVLGIIGMVLLGFRVKAQA